MDDEELTATEMRQGEPLEAARGVVAADATASASYRIKAPDGETDTVVAARSPDGRIRVPNEHGFSEEERADLGTFRVAEELRILGDLGGAGMGESIAHDYEQAIEVLAPNPMERLLIQNAFLQTAVAANLAVRSLRSDHVKLSQRDAELSQRATNSVRKLALALEHYRRPNVRIHNAGQVNVTNGPQQIVNGGEPSPDEATTRPEIRLA